MKGANIKGITIKRLRNFQGISQSELALMLGISQSYLSQIEADLKVPSEKLLNKIKETLNISLLFID